MKACLLAVLCAVVAPAIAAAQQVVVPPDAEAAKSGCTGFSYTVTLSSVSRTVTGMYIRGIDSHSPSALAGLRGGDTVVAINERPVSEGGIGDRWRTPPGSPYVITVLRAGKPAKISFASGALGAQDPDPEKPRACRAAKPEGK